MRVKLAQMCDLNNGRMLKYVMDNRCYSRDLMASWYGHFVYCGRINSYPSCNCFNCSSGQLNFREEGALANEYGIHVEANTIFDDSLSTMGIDIHGEFTKT